MNREPESPACGHGTPLGQHCPMCFPAPCFYCGTFLDEDGRCPECWNTGKPSSEPSLREAQRNFMRKHKGAYEALRDEPSLSPCGLCSDPLPHTHKLESKITYAQLLSEHADLTAHVSDLERENERLRAHLREMIGCCDESNTAFAMTNDHTTSEQRSHDVIIAKWRVLCRVLEAYRKVEE